MILGKNVIMTLGDTTRGIAASKSCHLSINTEFIEVCSPVVGSWKEYLPSIKSWSANVDTIVASLSDHKKLLKYQDNNQKLVCCFFDANLQEFYKGYCYIKNLELKATVGSLATMTVSIQPTGKLEWSEEVDIDMMEGVPAMNYSLLYTNTGTFRVVYVSGLGCHLKEIVTESDTRITLTRKGVIINDYLDNVIMQLRSLDNDTLKASAIMVNSSGTEKSVVVKGNGKCVTIIMNDANISGDAQGTYISKI